MNERIREIALQAGGSHYPEVNSMQLQKFAELIIAECAQACMNEGASYEEKAAGAYQSNLYVTAIKQHFGLEEQSTEPNVLHTCPYAEEIHGDYETLCDCDAERQYQCAMDV
jgi:hypothetical protein